MKKILSFTLAASLALTLVGCGNKTVEQDTPVTPPPVVEDVVEGTPQINTNGSSAKGDEENTVGTTLYDAFSEIADGEKDSLTIAKELIGNEIIPFAGDAIEIEPGLLNGFGETEIVGFKDGAMFAPMIGTIPFVGYVFTLEDTTDVKEFKETLTTSANLRWNVCTEAEEMVVGDYNNVVFFVMSPKSFEETAESEEITMEAMEAMGKALGEAASEVVENAETLTEELSEKAE